MAKVTIVGNALVVTSTLKLDDIISVQNHKPDALTLKDEKGESLVFAIGVTSKAGALTANGALFDGATRDDDGFATITMAAEFQCDNEELKEAVAESLGGALASLEKIEASLPAVVAEINDAKAKVMENISIL